jgi:hypothetical protein
MQLIALLIGYPIVTLFIKQEFNNTFSLFVMFVFILYVFCLVFENCVGFEKIANASESNILVVSLTHNAGIFMR